MQLIRANRVDVYSEALAFDRSDTDTFDRFLTPSPAGYAAWAHLYKKTVAEQHGLRFRTDVVTAEDAIFNFQFLRSCHRVATTTGILYYYNRFNYTSSTKRYFPDANKSVWIMCEERRKLYGEELTLQQHLKEDDAFIYSLNGLFFDYVYFLPRERAISKFRETHRMFGNFLPQIYPYEKGYDKIGGSIPLWLEYKHFLDEEDYDGLYDFFASRDNPRTREQKFPFIRKILIKLREFQIFTLKWGFH